MEMPRNAMESAKNVQTIAHDTGKYSIYHGDALCYNNQENIIS